MLRSLALLALLALAGPASAQVVGGRVFVDLDADGLADTGEPGIPGVAASLVDGTTEPTAADGTFLLPSPAGCAALALGLAPEPDPATGTTGGAFRRIEADWRTCPAPGANPVGRTRYGVARHLAAGLSRPSLLLMQVGDSIAAGESYCLWEDSDYAPEVASDLDCLGPGSVALQNRAVSGSHSDDLLTTLEGGSPNPQFVGQVVAAAPDVVTISIGGNDFLDTRPADARRWRPFAEADMQRSLEELIDVRRNVQEVLSVLASGLPDGDVVINSVYDNEAADCATDDFHAAATPVWNQVLRHAAWGQVRPLNVAEVAPELAHQDILRGSCCGAEDLVCTFFLDGIHPTHDGSEIIRHAILESLGRVEVPGTGATGVDVGALPLVAVLSPTLGPAEALALDGNGTAAAPGTTLTLSGFELPPGITPVRVVVGVRYRTTGAFADDVHRFDASVREFGAPQWTFTGWDTVTPIVGGSGGTGRIGTPSAVNALPNVPAWRDVTAMLTLDAVDEGAAYRWPSPTASDIGRLAVRLSVEAVGAPDAAAVEWDGAWAWVYGIAGAPGTPPGEVTGVLASRSAGELVLQWDEEPLADTYRAWLGTIGDWSAARCEPGVAGGCTPDLAWSEPMPAGDAFLLVSAVNAAGAGPLGTDSLGRARSAQPPACP